MDTPDTSPTPGSPQEPVAPASGAPQPPTSGTARASRPWGRYAVIAGVSALALVGAATIGAAALKGPRLEAARDVRMDGSAAHAPGAMARGRAVDRVIVMPARASVELAHAGDRRDGARTGPRGMDAAAREEQRAERLADLASELGLEADAVIAAVDGLHTELDAERDALREELADATVEERREAMQAFAEERRARMRELLIGLGADAEAVDAVLAEHAAEHGPMSRRGPRAGHSGGR
jgi:hypothetical protein